jgi:hypothetical protein
MPRLTIACDTYVPLQNNANRPHEFGRRIDLQHQSSRSVVTRATGRDVIRVIGQQDL